MLRYRLLETIRQSAAEQLAQAAMARPPQFAEVPGPDVGSGSLSAGGDPNTDLVGCFHEIDPPRCRVELGHMLPRIKLRGEAAGQVS
jgi:hypothetical protein